MGRGTWRRLSPHEVEDTLVDLLAELDVREGVPPALLSEPSVRYQFSNTADTGFFTVDNVRFIMEWSERVSAAMTSDVEALAGCTPGDQWDACSEGLATRVGRLAWRRPLTDADLSEVEGIYTGLAATEGAGPATRAILEYLFQSPDFWYVAADTRADGHTLTSHAVASRLSYMLWGSMPDAALREAADADALATPEQVRAQAARMLDDPRAEAAILRFHQEWLHLSSPSSLIKNPELYPDFDADTAADLQTEYDRFVLRVVAEGDVTELLSSRHGFVNRRLEPLYGLTPESDGDDDWRWRDLGEARAGVFTRPWFLASMAGAGESALIHRGVAVMERVLCMTPEPPDDVSDDTVAIPDGASSGKLLGVQNRASKPRCAACHDVIDPLGVAFESFDAVGAHRTVYPDGVAIEPAGELTRPEVVSYSTAAELMTGLAQTDTARQCYASKWLEWGTGHRPQGDELVEVARLADAASIRELILGVTASPLFLQRQEPTP